MDELTVAGSVSPPECSSRPLAACSGKRVRVHAHSFIMSPSPIDFSGRRRIRAALGGTEDGDVSALLTCSPCPHGGAALCVVCGPRAFIHHTRARSGGVRNWLLQLSMAGPCRQERAVARGSGVPHSWRCTYASARACTRTNKQTTYCSPRNYGHVIRPWDDKRTCVRRSSRLVAIPAAVAVNST